MAIAEVELRRLRWRCRRGLLENDLVLARFLERHAGTLNADDLAAMERLLALPDPELWELLSGRVDNADPRLAAMIERLRTA
jgi:succinate dehydrogenase flavin-adding protein (antitoxin of CptAB toxin-antitoxin module)